MNLPTTPSGSVTRLAIARAARAMSCGDLGEVVGVTAAQVSCWERGLAVPTPGQFAALALRLGWPRLELEREPVSERIGWLLAVAARNRMVRELNGLADGQT